MTTKWGGIAQFTETNAPTPLGYLEHKVLMSPPSVPLRILKGCLRAPQNSPSIASFLSCLHTYHSFCWLCHGPPLDQVPSGCYCYLLCGFMAIIRDLFLNIPSDSWDQAMLNRLYEEMRSVDNGRLITLRCGHPWILGAQTIAYPQGMLPWVVYSLMWPVRGQCISPKSWCSGTMLLKL